MTVAEVILLTFFLVATVKCFDSCQKDPRLCVQAVTGEVNSDLSLSCMANGKKKGGQWMYCGPKGSGIHFTMKWLKDGIPIERQSTRHFRFQNYYFSRPFVFTNFPNVTVTPYYHSGRTEHRNATFLVNITGKGGPEVDKQHMEADEKKFDDRESQDKVSPWVNFRMRPEQGFLRYEAMDLTHLHNYPDVMSAWDDGEPPEVSLNSYQEVVVVANIGDSVSFDCPIRTSIPLTKQIYWIFEYLPYIWTEERISERYFNESEETTMFNLTDPESVESCPFCDVTQRRWTLYVHTLTEEWDHSNLTCYIENTNGTARIVYKIEVLGVVPMENEVVPWFSFPYWCLQREFRVGIQCRYREDTTVVKIPPRTSPIVELNIDLWVHDYDRAKLTLNVVPLRCRSMDRSRPYHNCSEVYFWTEIEHFGSQPVEYSYDIYLGYPYTRGTMSTQYSGYMWFWDAYSYALGKENKPDPVYYWVEELKPPTQPPTTTTTTITTTTASVTKNERKPNTDRKSNRNGGLDNETKETQDSASKEGIVWILLGMSVVIFGIIVGVIIILVWMKICLKARTQTFCRPRKIVRITEMQTFLDQTQTIHISTVFVDEKDNALYLPMGSEHSEAPTEPTPLPEITIETCNGHESTTNLVSMCDYEIPLDPKWEISRSRLVMAGVLGEGAFGLVKKATAKDILINGCASPVAVKMLRDGSTEAELKSLLTELQVMKHISERGHPNVIQLLGCCTDSSSPVYLILEYAAHGNLKDYLRDSVSKLHRAKLLLSMGHPYPEDTVTVKTLLYFAQQVASGMEYIASMRIVHRDLAARNVLVADNHLLKITDFGFTRLLQDTEYYRTQNNGRFPVKWMAPEAISENRCTTKSDVWSFGVLMWELFSLGGNPYPFVPFEVMMEQLQKGLRMIRPLNCPDVLYRLMLMCWAHSPKKRPSFSKLYDFLSQVHASQTQDGLPVMPKLDQEEMKWYYVGSFARASASNFPYPASSAERDPGLRMSRDDLQSQNSHKCYKSYSSEQDSSVGDSSVPLTPPQSEVFTRLKSGEAVCGQKLTCYPILNTMAFTHSVDNLKDRVFEEGSQFPCSSSNPGVEIHTGMVDMYQHSDNKDSRRSLRLSTSPENIRNKSSFCSVDTSQQKVRFKPVCFPPEREEMHAAKCLRSQEKSTILQSSFSPKIKKMLQSELALDSVEDKFDPCLSPISQKTGYSTFQVHPYVSKSCDSLPKVRDSSEEEELCSKIMTTQRQQSMQSCSESSPSRATVCKPQSMEDLYTTYSMKAADQPLVTKVTSKSQDGTDCKTPLLHMSGEAESDQALFSELDDKVLQ